MPKRSDATALGRASAILKRLVPLVRILARKNRIYRRELAAQYRSHFWDKQALMHAFGNKGYQTWLEKRDDLAKRFRLLSAADVQDWRAYYVREVFAEGFSRAWAVQNEMRTSAQTSALLDASGDRIGGGEAKALPPPIEVVSREFATSKANVMLFEVTKRWDHGFWREWDASQKVPAPDTSADEDVQISEVARPINDQMGETE